jgi:hypothetical protein
VSIDILVAEYSQQVICRQHRNEHEEVKPKRHMCTHYSTLIDEDES